MEKALSIVTSSVLQYPEKREQLALLAEAAIPPPPVSARARQLLDQGILCDLREGNAPYRPRYTMPDYGRALRRGSAYLDLAPAEDLIDAVNHLLILYRHVPSVTGMPVYLGHIDALLEPFWHTVGPDLRKRLLRLFFDNLGRTMPSGFAHANLGPDDSEVARAVLDLEAERGQAVPNLSLKITPQSPDSLLRAAAACAMACGKPYFVNHPELSRALGRPYGVASCFNTLPERGGSHTLVRLDLKALATI